MHGESLHFAGRLLRHRRVSTTNRYVHLDDATLSEVAERVVVAIHRKLSPTREPLPLIPPIGILHLKPRAADSGA